MKEVIGGSTIYAVKKMIAEESVEVKPRVPSVHCSWCTNCSGIVGD